jgi:hypothetical protein
VSYSAQVGTDLYWISARVTRDDRIAQIWWW